MNNAIREIARLLGRTAVLPLIALPLASYAQVTVELRLPVSKAVLLEPLMAQVFIMNNSARLLSFGSDPGSAKLSFEVEDRDGRIVRPFSDRSLLHGADIMPGQNRTFDVGLTSSHGITAARSYRIRAIVECDSVCYGSRAVWLDVVKGMEVAKLRAGIPGDPLASRLYSLEYIQRDREEYLYLRIDDEAERVSYGAFNLGRVIRAVKPSIRVDTAGNVHAFFQAPGVNMIHASYTPYGEFLFSNVIEGSVTIDEASHRAQDAGGGRREE